MPLRFCFAGFCYVPLAALCLLIAMQTRASHALQPRLAGAGPQRPISSPPTQPAVPPPPTTPPSVPPPFPPTGLPPIPSPSWPTTPVASPPPTSDEVLKQKLVEQQAEAIRTHAGAIEHVAAIEEKDPATVLQELQAIPTARWEEELKRRRERDGIHSRRAKSVLSEALFPRPKEAFGLVEMFFSSGLDYYQWNGDVEKPFELEADVGVRIVLLPISSMNIGLYAYTGLAAPLRDMSRLVDTLNAQPTFATGDSRSNRSQDMLRLMANRWDLSGGIQGRFLAFGKADIFRGIIAALGYRGSVMGGMDHGIEANFGLDVWRFRLVGTWFKSFSGPLKEMGNQTFGGRLEWRFGTLFKGAGF